ncbi:MAG: ATP-binding cassette domain-containing protein [Candidatus Paracaedibacteraceae bacterium]|nr:ATP-binding cassette domain-containing protein [Candidatus Paracaedibacteraceae bacterium]
MTTLIEVKNLSTQFGSQVVHKNLNLSVKEGEVLGIVGGSGSGKSVLMRYVIGLEAPQKGKIIYNIPDGFHPSQIGVLFQHGALLSSMSVMENIMTPLLEVAKLSVDIARNLALLKIELVGLPMDTAFKSPAELSGGMIKRAALARSLALEPPILFLDEPTSGLDPISAAAFDKLIKDLQKNLNITVVMITHDLDSLVQICDRVAVLVDHRVLIGSVAEIVKIDHPWIKEYFHGSRGERYFR